MALEIRSGGALEGFLRFREDLAHDRHEKLLEARRLDAGSLCEGAEASLQLVGLQRPSIGEHERLDDPAQVSDILFCLKTTVDLPLLRVR